MRPGDLALWRFMEHESLVLVLSRATQIHDSDPDDPEYWDVFGKIFEGSDPSVYVARDCELTLAQEAASPRAQSMQEAAAGPAPAGPSGAAVIDEIEHDI